jgi:hypothetical protein
MRLSPSLVSGSTARKTMSRRPQKTASFLALSLRDMFPEGLSAELASREAILAGLEYLLDNLDGVRRGTQKHDRLMRKVATASRPLAMARTICKDYASLQHVESDHPLDASDVQELRVRVQRRQGVIYPEQEPRFRDLDRLALQGKLTAAALSEAARTLSLFKQPGPLDRNWARAELLAELALSGGSEQLS